MDFSSRPGPSALSRKMHVPPIDASASFTFDNNNSNGSQQSGRPPASPLASSLVSGFHGSSGMLQGMSSGAGPSVSPSSQLAGSAGQSGGAIGRPYDFLEDAVKNNFLFACLTPDQRRCGFVFEGQYFQFPNLYPIPIPLSHFLHLKPNRKGRCWHCLNGDWSGPAISSFGRVKLGTPSTLLIREHSMCTLFSTPALSQNTCTHTPASRARLHPLESWRCCTQSNARQWWSPAKRGCCGCCTDSHSGRRCRFVHK